LRKLWHLRSGASKGVSPSSPASGTIDGRDFTLCEFMTIVGSFGGWGMRIQFVPDDELHERPEVKVREPDSTQTGVTQAVQP